MDSGRPPTATVRARRVEPTSVRALRFRDHVAASLWFVPTCVVVVAFVASRVTVAVDGAAGRADVPAYLVPGDAAAISSVAATITAAMLTFLAVVFSTTLVAVQLASTQYSPRVVRVFVRSRATQATLAVFLATFVFALNTLLATRSRTEPVVPVLTVTLLYVLVIATVAMFVVFFHRIVRLLRVQYLLLAITRDAHSVLDADFPEESAYSTAERPVPDPDPAEVRHHGRPAVVQAIDLGGLADAAGVTGAWVEFTVAVGQHLGHRTLVARVHHDHDGTVAADVAKRLVLDGERTSLQDPAFGIRQLVDAASRALSPAVNDPTTAVQATDRISDLLMRISDRPDPTGWFVDRHGDARVQLPEDDFERLATLAFTEIARYGAGAPQVVRCLRATYAQVGEAVTPERRAVMQRLAAQLDAAVEHDMPPAFRDVSSTEDPLGLG